MAPSGSWCCNRWLIVLAGGLGVAFALQAFRYQWRYSELPPDLDCEALGYPARIEHLPAASCERLEFLAESWRPGTTVTIVDADGFRQPVTLVLREGTVGLLLTGLSGLVFLAAAVFFFAPRCRRPGVGCFFWLTLLYGLAIMVGGVFFPREDRAWRTLFSLVQICCLAALPAVFLHLTLSFPQRSATLDRRPWLLPAAYGLAIGIAAWQAAVLLPYYAAPTLARGGRLGPAFAAADVFMIALTVVGVGVFIGRGRRLANVRERNQVRWLLWGFAIGAAPYVFLRTLPSLVGLQPLMPDFLDRVVELAIPFAFAMAVVRHQFLDIDVIIRRSLLYGVLAAALVGLHLAAGLAFGYAMQKPRGPEPWILPVILGLIAGAAFRPLRQAIGRWIDRAFFKLGYDRERTLDRLDRALQELATAPALAERLHHEIAGSLRPTRAAVILDGGGEPAVCGDAPANAADLLGELAGIGGAPLAAAHAVALPDSRRRDPPASLLAEGFVLAQPLAGERGLRGLLLLGPRLNERHYIDQDLLLLDGCARLATRHLERIALVQAVAEEALAHRRLAELEALKSEFLAHVAHDLRTPVASIAWSAHNLRDGVVGDLTPEQASYVQSIARSGDHLNHLVTNLLEISRLDRADQALALDTVDPVRTWEQAIGLVSALAAEKRLEIEIVGAEAAAPVLADADKLAEVAVNLLDNAIKYSERAGRVTVAFAPPTAAGQDVSVRDRGPGLGPRPAELLGRFVQGDPSPSSARKGFGLGLHIASTYLSLMGGSLDVANHPEGGAVFTCRLPLSRRAGGEKGPS